MDLYAELGLAHTADAAAIRAAYRTLAKRYHPDVSKLPDAHARFIRLTEAYEILIDPVKRHRYDLSRLSPHPRNAPTAQQARYERDVRGYQQQARARAEHFGRMRYADFDKNYFRTAMGYAVPKMLGCFGIGIIGLAVVSILATILEVIDAPRGARITVFILVSFAFLPTVVWFSMRFDQWHNAYQREKRGRH